MSRVLIECFAMVHPIGHRPFREQPELRFRENRELKSQLAAYAKRTWFPAAREVLVEVHRKTVDKQLTIKGQIIVDRVPKARFSLHAHRRPAPASILPGERL